VTDPIEGSGEETEPGARAAPAGEGAEAIRSRVVDVLRTVYDPEIPVDIYELGLVYEVDVREDGSVYLRMTLTSPMCPVAESLPPEVEAKVRGVAGVKDVELDLVWEPPWNPSMMSEAARLELGM
jgi:FeS assembly SUF system protein